MLKCNGESKYSILEQISLLISFYYDRLLQEFDLQKTTTFMNLDIFKQPTPAAATHSQLCKLVHCFNINNNAISFIISKSCFYLSK